MAPCTTIPFNPTRSITSTIATGGWCFQPSDVSARAKSCSSTTTANPRTVRKSMHTIWMGRCTGESWMAVGNPVLGETGFSLRLYVELLLGDHRPVVVHQDC